MIGFVRNEARSLLAVALILGIGPLLATPAVAAANVGNTLYVDGKLGLDSNDGASPGSPFKTIAKATGSIPSGSGAAGWTVVVQGYTDYIYRERPIPPGWNGQGNASAPVLFRAAGYVAGGSGYVKPIVSGSEIAPASGQHWTASGTSGVWKTPWATAPFDYGKAWGPRGIAIFEDGTKWLWACSSLSSLASAAVKGTGGFWWDSAHKQLYVSAVSSSGPSGANPTGHSVDVIMRNAFYFNGVDGVRYVEVRGFQVEHSANGISFDAGTDYGTAADNVVIANLYMGIATSGYRAAGAANLSIGHTIERNSGSYNTIQAIKADEGTQNSTFCGNSLSHNGLQGIKLQGPPVGSDFTGITTGNTICDNDLFSNNYNPTGSTYNNSSGLTIANGALNTVVTGNRAWGNDVGIMMTQEGGARPAMDNTSLSWNKLWSNRRFGLYFLDGYYGSGSGIVTSSHDVIWGNGMGVMVDRGSTHKTIDHATIHANTGDGIHLGGYQVAAASLTLSNSIVTGNKGDGIWIVTGNSATLSHDCFYANSTGAVYGSGSFTSLNYQSPSYLSATSSDPKFLMISTSSYQATAGPGGSLIGALGTGDPPGVASATYVPVTPNRLADSRAGIRLGVSASLTSGTPAHFQVTDRSPDPALNIPSNAVAVTGNLTTVKSTSAGYFSLTPARPSGVPTTSTLNFPKGDTRANAVTVPLGSGGVLWVTFVGSGGAKADVVFDVTGYFLGGSSGATYLTVTPNRIVDSRAGTRLGLASTLQTGVPAQIQVTDRSDDPALRIPSSAVAITGNLTVVNSTSPGFFSLTIDRPASTPTTSTLNFPKADVRANAVTVPLGSGGVLWLTFIGGSGATADAVFDVTGYFVADASGAVYVPVEPNRLVDSRSKLGVPARLTSGTPTQFPVANRALVVTGSVPADAAAVTGNLTTVNSTSSGHFALTPDRPAGTPKTSTLNFPKGEVRANAVTVPLGSGGVLWVTFIGSGGAKADVVFDVTGYFTK